MIILLQFMLVFLQFSNQGFDLNRPMTRFAKNKPCIMNLRRTTVYLSLIFMLAACKKDDFISGNNQRLVSITLNTQYLTANHIDSAFLFTRFIGDETKTKLELKDNRLET